MRIVTMAMAAAAFAFSCVAHAQWLNERTPGIPRLPDGKPNLSAPAPRTADGKPDLSGLWLPSLHPAYMLNVLADLDPADIQPWAERAYIDRMNNLGTDDPASIGCQPFGPRHILGSTLAELSHTKIIQTQAAVFLLHEDLAYRQIFMDGRKLPDDPVASFMGYSVGRWEGDELVVESNGFKDSTWLDFGGHPHTESLHITERYRRVDFGHIQRRITLTDPKTFNKPVTVSSDMTLTPDTEMLEYVCTETPRDRFSLVGRTEAEKKVHVPPEILARYVGDYDFEAANTFNIHRLTVKLVDDQLFADFNGKGHVPLVPLSNTMFSPRLLGTFEFFVDERGVVTHVLAHGVAGDLEGRPQQRQ